MMTIARLAAALAGLAASGGLGCRGSDPRAERSSAAAAASPAGAPAPAQRAAEAAGAAGAAAPPPSPAYASDIEKLCDVVRLSNAEIESPEDRRLPIANWLAANLTTAESRQFLVQIQPLIGDQKADALEAEARRVGLPGCALAAEWRAPRTR
jgi:hypothetical protein